jgi:Polyketide cyclase / dehydrase and lipid transport
VFGAVVRVRDEESRFDASLASVWQLVRAHRREMPSIHPTVRNVRVEQLAEGIGLASWEMEFLGTPVTMRTRVVQFPPLGKLIEYLQGPLAGSKELTYYTPEGERTRVSVVGEYRSPTLPEDDLADAVARWHAVEFDEDAAYLRTLASAPRADPP